MGGNNSGEALSTKIELQLAGLCGLCALGGEVRPGGDIARGGRKFSVNSCPTRKPHE
jgi:hypothetical protein